MIEIRKLLRRRGNGKYLSVTLQYRYITPACDASGALSAHGSQWSEWHDVKDIDAETGEVFITERERLKLEEEKLAAENLEDENDDPELHD